jgi:hypothetical protein
MAYWDRTKNNRLKKPSFLKADTNWRKHLPTNWCGQTNATIGNYVHQDGSVSAGVVGKIIQIIPSAIGDIAEFETLSGEIKQCWLGACTVIDYDAVQEVKDFYIADGRPKRIKVFW